MGPLAQLGRKLRKLPAYVATPSEYFLCIPGLCIQFVLRKYRPSKGFLKFSYKNIIVSVIYDDGPETDHYGESPIFSDKLDTFEHRAQEEASKTKSPIAFLFISGARHLYIEKLLKLEDQKKLQNFAIFGRNLYRPKSQDILNKRPKGFFLQGTNTTSSDEVIYSDHCLSIGAGDMELWCYADDQKSLLKR